MLDVVKSPAPAIRGMFIGGQWVPAARTFEDLNPSDNTVYARIPDGSAADMRRAIDAAQAALATGPAAPSMNARICF